MLATGDLSTHGFAILDLDLDLDLLRRQFPATRSILMDRPTLFAHESQWATEPSSARMNDQLTVHNGWQ